MNHPENVNNGLSQITYRGNANFNGNDEIVLTVSDGELNDTETITVTVTPVNDAPILTVPDSQTVPEDTDIAIAGIALADLDLDVDSGDLEVTVSASNGVLSLSQTEGLTFSTGDGTADASLVFTGTLSDINNALSQLTYRGNSNFNGDDNISIKVSDLGNTGAGGELTDSKVIAITVTPTGGEDIVLLEGNNFRVDAQRAIAIPDTPSLLSFTYTDLNFDTSDADFINDAFEVALVDSEGNSLVHTIAGSRDAFFNLTEGESASLANGVTVNGQTVTVNLAGITPGTEGTLIFRLVNNDGDVTSTVRIADIFVEAADVNSPGGVTPAIWC